MRVYVCVCPSDAEDAAAGADAHAGLAGRVAGPRELGAAAAPQESCMHYVCYIIYMYV